MIGNLKQSVVKIKIIVLNTQYCKFIYITLLEVYIYIYKYIYIYIYVNDKIWLNTYLKTFSSLFFFNLFALT